MNTIEILSRLEKVKFTAEQARTITEIFEEHHHELATKENVKSIGEDIKYMDAKMATKDDVKTVKDDVKNMDSKMATKDGLQAEILKSKYDLVKWIVGGFIANGMVNALLKYLG